MTAPSNRLGLAALTALVVGSMVGAGIFSLPQNIARSAGPGAALVGWAISGLGMLMLAFVFQNLANRKPQLDAGIYAYAKAGFGDYIGFSSAWGYWICSLLGNVSFFVLIFSGLGYFVPAFGEGNTWQAIACASVLLWAMHAMVLRGIGQAALINAVVTVAKVVPIVVFVVIAAVGFRLEVFTADFWGTLSLGGLGGQLRGMMLITVWVFIGIEGASIYSRRAARRADVGRATVIGFLGVLALLMLVNLLSMGVLGQQQLAHLHNPSMAFVLEAIVGPWGARLIIIGMVVSVLGALLAWVLLCAEVLHAAAGDGTMPVFLARQNANDVPANALWLTNGLIQLFLLITLFSASTYTSLVLLGASMALVPYLFSAAYGVLVAWRGEGYADPSAPRRRDLVIAVLATVYALWLVYAGGVTQVLLSALLYAPGMLMFAQAKRQHGQPVFTPVERLIAVCVLAVSLAAVWGLWHGHLTLG
ncbi:arginine-ornithine antiporter [Stenotrophomonas rhizophila]|uniref:arginine-ornithine antiporter n=1 Tax=Stenotrophomonas rhizophila TaxID=216778 RepID=UPI0028D81034|nr:arginine-ornithine antiporter [Stenotrophomonas rhizophila]